MGWTKKAAEQMADVLDNLEGPTTWDPAVVAEMRRLAPSVVMALSDLEGHPILWQRMPYNIRPGDTFDVTSHVSVYLDSVEIARYQPVSVRMDGNIAYVTGERIEALS